MRIGLTAAILLIIGSVTLTSQVKGQRGGLKGNRSLDRAIRAEVPTGDLSLFLRHVTGLRRTPIEKDDIDIPGALQGQDDGDVDTGNGKTSVLLPGQTGDQGTASLPQCQPGYVRDTSTNECKVPGCGCPVDPRNWQMPYRPCRSFYGCNQLSHRGLFDNRAYKFGSYDRGIYQNRNNSYQRYGPGQLDRVMGLQQENYGGYAYDQTYY